MKKKWEKDTPVHFKQGKRHFCQAPKKKVTSVSKKTVLSRMFSNFLPDFLDCKKDISVLNMTKFYFFFFSHFKAMFCSSGNREQSEIQE